MSLTKRPIAARTIARLVEASFGTGVGVVSSAELDGGGFATVVRVDLSDGRTVVLKVAPALDVPLLRYERGITGAEARYLSLVDRMLDGALLPKLIAHGRDGDGFDSEWIFISRMPGATLKMQRDSGCLPEDADLVRADLGALVAQLHAVTGDRFGYDDDRPHGDTWREAYLAMLAALLADAQDWSVDLGMPVGELQRLVTSRSGVLDTVDRPALLHFDLWDGNLLCGPNADGRLRLTGLVDGERYLFGDPLMDFVSPALYRHIEDEPRNAFVRGYGAGRGRPVTFDGAAVRRLTLYRLHMYLLMTIEMPSRGITAQSRPDRYELLGTLVRRQLDEIASWQAGSGPGRG